MNELLKKAQALGLDRPNDEPRDTLVRMLDWYRSHVPDEHDPDHQSHLETVCAIQHELARLTAPASA